jgi:hypothetical protein
MCQDKLSIDMSSSMATEDIELGDDSLEAESDDENVPDIGDIELTKKETFYYKIIDKYYKTLDQKKVIMMIDIIESRSKISLRLLDWFVTKYSDKHVIRFDKPDNENDDDEMDIFDKKIDKGFNVHISYKAQLKSYKKKYFDPFRRRKKFKYYFNKDKTLFLCTTIGQLNFFRWMFVNNVIDYVSANFSTILKAMGNTTKADKMKKLKEKTTKEVQETEKETVSITKNNIVISAKKKVVRNEVKIILSFD